MVRSRTGSVQAYHARRLNIALAKSTVASLMARMRAEDASDMSFSCVAVLACGESPPSESRLPAIEL